MKETKQYIRAEEKENGVTELIIKANALFVVFVMLKLYRSISSDAKLFFMEKLLEEGLES